MQSVRQKSLLQVKTCLFLLVIFHAESFQLLSLKIGRSRVAGCETTLVAAVAATDDTNNNNNEPDLFEYFDPLLSPHAYPKGVSPKNKPDRRYNREDDEEERYDPLRLNLDFLPPIPTPPTTTKRRPSVVAANPFVFDPTLSPHMYPQGTPSTVIGDEVSDDFYDQQPTPFASSRRIGILLVDHGSRNKESNERLHELARLYQDTVDSHVIVQAAHMEIATPSIPEGLASLADAGVDEIICHPFFLSPLGRHVKDDIPAIVNDAIETLNIRVPICTTKPVGSNTDLMLTAIHTLVQESSSTVLRQNNKLN